MGENADIKQYDFHPSDGSLALFPTSESKAAIVTKLLKADWLTKASRPWSKGTHPSPVPWARVTACFAKASM